MSGFIMMRRPGGRKYLVKKRRGPTVSRHLYNARSGVLRSTLPQSPQEAEPMYVHNTTGDKVRLIEHGNHATFAPWDGGESHTVPSYEFFRDHREATREEIEASEKDSKKGAAENASETGSHSRGGETEASKKAAEKEPTK